MLSHQVASELEKIPGFIDVCSEASIGKREVHVIVDRERAKKMDFTPQEIARNIEVAMRGVNLRRIQEKEGEIMVRVEFQKEEKRTLNHLRDLTIFQNNQPVKLVSLDDLELAHRPRSIRRENRITSIGVSIDLKDLTVNEAKQKISPALKNFKFPDS